MTNFKMTNFLFSRGHVQPNFFIFGCTCVCGMVYNYNFVNKIRHRCNYPADEDLLIIGGNYDANLFLLIHISRSS